MKLEMIANREEDMLFTKEPYDDNELITDSCWAVRIKRKVSCNQAPLIRGRGDRDCRRCNIQLCYQSLLSKNYYCSQRDWRRLYTT